MESYDFLSDKELSEELADIERDIVFSRNAMLRHRANMNKHMQDRDDIIIEMKRRGSTRNG